MPGTKRKAQNALSGPSTKRGTGTRNVEDAEAIETAGMMERAMEDDMIDDDDDDDDMSDEDEEEDGMNEDDEQDNDDEDGADDEDVVFGQNDGDDLDDGETYGGFQDLEDGESADDDAIDSGDEQKDEGKASKGKSSSSKSQATTREKKKPNTKSLFKPVTNEEMTTLRNEGEIRGGTFEFGMKINALLSATFLDPLPSSSSAAYTPPPPPPILSKILKSIHSHISNMPTLPPLAPKRAAERLAPVLIPFVSPSPLSESGAKEVNWTLGWEKPKEIFVCGSWGVLGSYRNGRKADEGSQGANKGKGKGKEVEIGSIDLAVVMPESMFTPKDRLSNRYFHKRNHYMAVLASSFDNLALSGGANVDSKSQKKGKKIDDPADTEMKVTWAGMRVEWEYAGGNERRPIIVLTFPKNKELGLKFSHSIRLLASLPQDVFSLASLSPGKGNLRTAQTTEDTPNPPSPLYNTSILMDTLHRVHLLHLHQVHKSCPSFRSALALWRIWGNRRGLSTRCGNGMGWGWFGSMILAFVIDGGEIGGGGSEREVKRPRKGLGRGLSEWQLLRAGWELLASTDFSKTPLYMKSSNEFMIPPLEFTRNFNHIFVDPSGTVNILATWEEGELGYLKHQARITLEALSDSSLDHFDDVFLRSLQSDQLQFDECLQIDAASAVAIKSSSLAILERPARTIRIASDMASILRRGLSNRVRLVSVTSSAVRRWAVKDTAQDAAHISIGLLLNKEQAYRILDQGPPDGHKAESAAFRQLWGSKAELRRFKDGSITESVVWSAQRPEELALIPGKAAKWLISLHFGVDENQVAWHDGDFASLLQIPTAAHRLTHREGSEKEGFRPALSAFEELYKVLKGADDDLPLSILNFTPTSEFLRYTSTFVPHSTDFDRSQGLAPFNLRYFPAIDVLLQFESSRKWPDDLIAIQKVKIAFFVRLAAVVEEKLPGSSASVVLEPDAPDIQDHAALEVKLSKGFVFRLRIYHDRERTLLERMVEDQDIKSEKLRQIAQETFSLHLRRFTGGPRHHAAIANLHHHHASFATTTRLFKRWISSHMLSGYLRPEQLELIVAEVYLNSAPFDPPGSAVTGLARVLDRLANWNWQETPLYVPLYSVAEGSENQRTTFPADAHARAESEFATLRKVDPGFNNGTMIIVTEEDLRGTAWGEPVGRVIAGRITALAKGASELLLGSVGVQDFASLSVYQSSLADYDFVLHLDPNATTRLSQSINAHTDPSLIKGWEKYVHRGTASGLVITPDFDPASSLVSDLRRLYSPHILFFHDAHGGLSIGCLFNPSTTSARRNFRPFLGFNTAPVGNNADAGEAKEGQGQGLSSGMVEINKKAIVEEMKRLSGGMVVRVDVNRE